MRLNPANVAEYFATARERYTILLRRRAGESKPWTGDPVMRTWRFCNVFREDDRVTEWIRQEVRRWLSPEDRVIRAMTACRLFNRIETLAKLKQVGQLTNWDRSIVLAVLRDEHPVVGAAYVVKTPNGMDKLHGVVDMVDAVDARYRELAVAFRQENTLEYAWSQMQQFPCIGSFIAYEIVSDLRHTDLLKDAYDIMTWSVPGPGACRGLSWLIACNSEVLGYGGNLAKQYALPMMQELLAASFDTAYWPSNWPAWEMREVEHWLCEYYKWVRVKYLGDRMKRRFT